MWYRMQKGREHCKTNDSRVRDELISKGFKWADAPKQEPRAGKGNQTKKDEPTEVEED